MTFPQFPAQSCWWVWRPTSRSRPCLNRSSCSSTTVIPARAATASNVLPTSSCSPLPPWTKRALRAGRVYHPGGDGLFAVRGSRPPVARVGARARRQPRGTLRTEDPRGRVPRAWKRRTEDAMKSRPSAGQATAGRGSPGAAAKRPSAWYSAAWSSARRSRRNHTSAASRLLGIRAVCPTSGAARGNKIAACPVRRST